MQNSNKPRITLSNLSNGNFRGQTLKEAQQELSAPLKSNSYLGVGIPSISKFDARVRESDKIDLEMEKENIYLQKSFSQQDQKGAINKDLIFRTMSQQPKPVNITQNEKLNDDRRNQARRLSEVQPIEECFSKPYQINEEAYLELRKDEILGSLKKLARDNDSISFLEEEVGMELRNVDPDVLAEEIRQATSLFDFFPLDLASLRDEEVLMIEPVELIRPVDELEFEKYNLMIDESKYDYSY